MKRKARKEPKEHKQIDRMVPLDYEQLGGINDPCFGKHFSIKAAECQRCGDSEICSMACNNKVLLQIEQQSKSSRFKDVEEGQLIDEQNKSAGNDLLKRAKKVEGVWLYFEKRVPKYQEKWNLTDKDKPIILQRLIKAANGNKELKVNKSNTKYKFP